ncbi:uncharacterized protein K02A2.6-like [Topomyia yanbarensis]|uniref:uncharacterized protein K02A2.6-like n=1 Tax=Topomyia yanbarensis TaxID=2498891 RepID=UPI00273C92BC|nr:uncharacterized protein K02A2.6-like [Topomyia yanbarensis]
MNHSRIKPFDVAIEASRLPAEWEVWRLDLESFFVAQRIESQRDKRAQLAYLGGPGLQNLLRLLPLADRVPHVTQDPPYYDVAVSCLNEYFEPFRRKIYERHLFHKIVQDREERFTDFVMRLRKQIARCNYDQSVTDQLIADRITTGCLSDELRTKLLQKDRSLEEIVGGVDVPMTIDSGADANIITQEVWEQMKKADVNALGMSTDVDRTLTSYAAEKPLQIVGMFSAEVVAGQNRSFAKFYVVKDGQQCLLGDRTARDLKVLKVGFDVCSVQGDGKQPFPKIRDVVVEIPVDQNIQPVQQPYRRPPIALEEKIETKLKLLLNQEIIESVTGPSPWVSPMVPVIKDNGDIRLCIDMRRANQAVIRESHPLPLVDDLLGSVKGAVRFSKIDIKDAYHQIENSERSRPVTTFLTKNGLFRYKRLTFGVSCAPELFQKVMESLVAGLQGVIVYLDDILVYGTTVDEHDVRLKSFLNRLLEYNVLINKDKCIYNVEKLEFLGHELSINGVRPTESRIAALQNFRDPLNVSELRSFLGLVGYVGRFIPNLAAKTDPLRQLLRSGSAFNWTDKEKSAFRLIKEALSNISYLGFFNPKDQSKLITDASPTGLGAILLQENIAGETRVIAYASKALTDLEKKYFQTEREALSLVWGVEKFRHYLLGVRFTLLTDCKALKFLFSPRSRPCARIERWVLRLQGYSYEIEHISGSANLADAFSRLSVSSNAQFDRSTEAYIRYVSNQAVPEALTFKDIVDATNNDKTIQEVVKALQCNRQEDIPSEYKPFMNEMYFAEGALLRGTRLIIPESLRERVIQIAHEAHPGIEAMKRRLRQKVWWPSMDKQVSIAVKSCKSCVLVSSLGAPEPLLRTKMPEKAWTDIAIDFMGPLPSGHSLLVIVDYFSRFTEIIVMKQTTAKRTIEALHETFCRFGVPESIKSDNGPQFISEELQQFCSEYGIELRKTTPYWPQANGEVERANRTILKHLKISQESSNSDWMWDLRTFLLMFNSTPHATTGLAPSSLMFGRILRDKLPNFTSTSAIQGTESARDHDWTKKLKGAEYSNTKRHAKPTELREGDVVVAKRTVKENKLSTTFAPEEFTVAELNGSDATLRSKTSGRIMHRNVAHLRPLVALNLAGKTLQRDDVNTSIIPIEQNTSTHERPSRIQRSPEYLRDYEI